MKLLLFGGTFDPPHNGHMNNLQAAMEAVRPDEVVVMPAGVPPHKAASATPAALRYEMCGCFRELFRGKAAPRLTVSRWEIERAEQGHKSYSVDTLRMLRESYPGARLYMTVGSDMLLTFKEWRDWRAILQLCTLVVQSREYGDGKELERAAGELRREGGNILLARAQALPMASREFRGGEAPLEQLPPLVQQLVQKHHLYGR